MNDVMIDLELRRWMERYEQFLDQIPQLLEGDARPGEPLEGGTHRHRASLGGWGEAPLPFRMNPVDDCDDLWAALVEYMGEVAERLQHPAPGATGASWAVSNSIRGIGAGMSGDQAYEAGFVLIAWLIDRGRFTYELRLKDSEQHLFGLIRELQGRYVGPPIESPSRRRLCSVCGEFAVVTAWVLGDAGEAECRVCGAVYAAEGDDRGMVDQKLVDELEKALRDDAYDGGMGALSPEEFTDLRARARCDGRRCVREGPDPDHLANVRAPGRAATRRAGCRSRRTAGR